MSSRPIGTFLSVMSCGCTSTISSIGSFSVMITAPVRPSRSPRVTRRICLRFYHDECGMLNVDVERRDAFTIEHSTSNVPRPSPMISEKQRISGDAHQRAHWAKWGPYLADRAWGTVREDYSANGDAWSYLPHDLARSKAYRWGEDGIGGFSDRYQILCFAMAFWNERDPILKERLFGLVPSEGNHGEDVKECYFYLDALPSHAYQRMLYKYPQRAYPYQQLIDENR